MLSVRSWSSKGPIELFLHRRINSKTKSSKARIKWIKCVRSGACALILPRCHNDMGICAHARYARHLNVLKKFARILTLLWVFSYSVSADENREYVQLLHPFSQQSGTPRHQINYRNDILDFGVLFNVPYDFPTNVEVKGMMSGLWRKNNEKWVTHRLCNSRINTKHYGTEWVYEFELKAPRNNNFSELCANFLDVCTFPSYVR